MADPGPSSSVLARPRASDLESSSTSAAVAGLASPSARARAKARVDESNRARIESLLKRKDAWRTTALARVAATRGLVAAPLRARAWPRLLGVDVDDGLDRAAFDDAAAPEFVAARHRDARVVDADVARSLWPYTSSWTEAEREAKRRELRFVLDAAVLAHERTLPGLVSYYQGLGDVAEIFLLVCEDPHVAAACVERLALFHLRDQTRPTLGSTLDALALVEPLLEAADEELHDHVFFRAPKEEDEDEEEDDDASSESDSDESSASSRKRTPFSFFFGGDGRSNKRRRAKSSAGAHFAVPWALAWHVHGISRDDDEEGETEEECERTARVAAEAAARSQVSEEAEEAAAEAAEAASETAPASSSSPSSSSPSFSRLVSDFESLLVPFVKHNARVAADARRLALAARLVDCFAVSHPAAPLYAGVASMIRDRDALLATDRDDPGEMHRALSRTNPINPIGGAPDRGKRTIGGGPSPSSSGGLGGGEELEKASSSESDAVLREVSERAFFAEAFAAFDRKRRTTVTVDPSPMDVDGGASGSGSSRGDSPPKKGGDGVVSGFVSGEEGGGIVVKTTPKTPPKTPPKATQKTTTAAAAASTHASSPSFWSLLMEDGSTPAPPPPSASQIARHETALRMRAERAHREAGMDETDLRRERLRDSARLRAAFDAAAAYAAAEERRRRLDALARLDATLASAREMMERHPPEAMYRRARIEPPRGSGVTAYPFPWREEAAASRFLSGGVNDDASTTTKRKGERARGGWGLGFGGEKNIQRGAEIGISESSPESESFAAALWNYFAVDATGLAALWDRPGAARTRRIAALRATRSAEVSAELEAAAREEAARREAEAAANEANEAKRAKAAGSWRRAGARVIAENASVRPFELATIRRALIGKAPLPDHLARGPAAPERIATKRAGAAADGDLAKGEDDPRRGGGGGVARFRYAGDGAWVRFPSRRRRVRRALARFARLLRHLAGFLVAAFVAVDFLFVAATAEATLAVRAYRRLLWFAELFADPIFADAARFAVRTVGGGVRTVGEGVCARVGTVAAGEGVCALVARKATGAWAGAVGGASVAEAFFDNRFGVRGIISGFGAVSERTTRRVFALAAEPWAVPAPWYMREG